MRGHRKRLKDLREQKALSQGDIEKRTGLLRCYVSRVENGHTVPAVETIEKMVRALEIPLYQLFIGAEESPNYAGSKGNSPARRREGRQLSRVASLLANMREKDRSLLLMLGSKMAGRRK
jgi:transcriptional regulator with XRE-family HTH domain